MLLSPAHVLVKPALQILHTVVSGNEGNTILYMHVPNIQLEELPIVTDLICTHVHSIYSILKGDHKVWNFDNCQISQGSQKHKTLPRVATCQSSKSKSSMSISSRSTSPASSTLGWQHKQFNSWASMFPVASPQCSTHTTGMVLSSHGALNWYLNICRPWNLDGKMALFWVKPDYREQYSWLINNHYAPCMM